MSADNGIYILRTKDQYRVAHLQAVESILGAAVDGFGQAGMPGEEDIPARLVELWGDCGYTRDPARALDIAHSWEHELGGCEYGVRVITCDRTWRQLEEAAHAGNGKSAGRTGGCC